MRRIDSAVPKPTRGGDGRHRLVGVLELAPGRGDARGGDVTGRRDADLGGEAAQEVALAHGDPRGQPAEPVVVGGVGVDQLLGAADRLVAGPPAPHGRGELALRPGPAQEHHQPAGDGLGDVDTVVVLDQRERDVDPGRHAGRRPHVAVSGPDRVGIDAHARVLGGQPRRPGPVRRRPAALEQAGGGEEERPAAHADDPAGPAASSPTAATSASSAAAACTPDPPGTISVSTSASGSSAVGHELQAALGAHGARRGRRRSRSRRRRGRATRRPRPLVAPAKTSWGPVTSRAWTPS